MKNIAKVAVVAFVAALFLNTALKAAEGGTEKAKEVTITGVVAKVMDAEKKKVTGYTLTVAATDKEKAETYSIEANDKNKGLAELDGKKVEVKGVVKEREGKKSIVVDTFKAVVEEPAAPVAAPK